MQLLLVARLGQVCSRVVKCRLEAMAYTLCAGSTKGVYVVLRGSAGIEEGSDFCPEVLQEQRQTTDTATLK